MKTKNLFLQDLQNLTNQLIDWYNAETDKVRKNNLKKQIKANQKILGL
jgi:hypothetical protein|tara:strand:+ start:443 stop:586 length:144 start_codon:yes stop_codon:yes gene_type:complete